MTDDEAEPLAEIAIKLAARVREYGADDNATWLKHMLPDPQDRFALVFVLAAAVPEDRPWRDLTAWAAERAQPPPAGQCPWAHLVSDAGARNHRAAGEQPCDGCDRQARTYEREKKARWRAKERTPDEQVAS